MAESFWSQLRPASWRGFSFAVDDSMLAFGRRNAVHQYPFRDTPWVEDLGRQAKRFQVRGFIHGDDVIAQRDSLIKLADEKADGELVHPTLGVRKVALLDVRSMERKDRGRCFELHFSFMEQGAQVYPSSTSSTGATTREKAALAKAAAVSSFAKKLKAAMSAGQGALQAVSDATKTAMSQLDALGTSVGLQPGRLSQAAAVLASDIIRGRQSNVLLRLGLDELRVVTSSLDGSTAGKYTAAVLNAVGAAALTGTLSKDWLRNVIGVATYSGLAEQNQPVAASYPAGVQVQSAGNATRALFRRSTVIAAAELSADYLPASSSEAADVRTMLASALQGEIELAGNTGDDEAYQTLKALRAAMVQDLNTRAALLPTLVVVRTPAPIPALLLAHRLYDDIDRTDELVAEAHPVHPAFMPTAFKALSS